MTGAHSLKRSLIYSARGNRNKILLAAVVFSLLYYSGLISFSAGPQEVVSEDAQVWNGDSRDVVVSLERRLSREGTGQQQAAPGKTSPRAIQAFTHLVNKTADSGPIMAHIGCFIIEFSIMANFFASCVKPLGLEKNTLFIFPSKPDHEKAGKLKMTSYHYAHTLHYGIDLKANVVQDKSVYRHLVMYDLLLTGNHAITTTGSTYWFSDPRSDILRQCGDCDIAIQNVETVDINHGIIYTRNTEASRDFYAKLIAEITKRGVDNSRTVFSDMLKKEGGSVKVVTLDQDRYPASAQYYEGGDRDEAGRIICDGCIALNDNHIMGTDAKIFRLQEHLLWNIDQDNYYSNEKAKYFLYDNLLPSLPDGEESGAHGINALKGALGVAIATERKLILPQFIETADGQIPLNGLFLISEFKKTFGDYYRESSFLINPLVPKSKSEKICGPILVENSFTENNDMVSGDAGENKVYRLKPADPEKGATGEEINKFLKENKLDQCATIRFLSMHQAFKGFENRKDNNTYYAQMDHGFVKGTYRQKELLGRSDVVLDTESGKQRPKTEEKRYEFSGEYMENILTPESVKDETKFTVMMPFFNRAATLPKILKHYLSLDKVDKVILLWYKDIKDMAKPEDLVPESHLNKKLMVKHMREDNLMIRFIMFPEVKTKAILSCDDDLIVYKDDLYRIFEFWKKHPHGIVGPYMRLAHRTSPGHYKYVWNPKIHYNIVLTNVAFYHRDWIPVLEQDLPPVINNTVREWTNCEDIALNFLVTSHCKAQSVFWIKPKKTPNHFSKLKASLSGRKSHALQRDLCVTKFVQAYGDKNPLLTFSGSAG